MKAISCCLCGHKRIPDKEPESLSYQIKDIVGLLIDSGVTTFLTGATIGFDTLAAQAVLEMKGIYPQIRLVIIATCPNPTRGFPECDKKIYDQIFSRADEVVYTSKYYYSGCVQKRNRTLVNMSGYCLCYLTDNKGETHTTVTYARRMGLKVLNLAKINT